jgi:thioredoxin-dependent peroxiredoxin
MSIQTGSPAPQFSLPDETGAIRSLSDFEGQTIILYFYPKDDTPGCTTEACNFRDDYSAFEQAGVTILGVSPDSPKSHAKFKEKFNLPFSLLADEQHEVCEQFGVWGPKKFMGREYMGVARTTFVIGPDGRVKKIFENVKPADHSTEVLAAVREE